MKVALLSDSFAPGVGGTEKVVYKLATLLSKEHQVMVFAPFYHQKFNDDTLPFKVVRVKSIQFTKNDCLAFPNLDKKFKRALKEFNPDIIHAHTLGAITGYAIKYAKKHNKPIISTVHTKYKYCFIEESKGLPFIPDILVKRIIKKANACDRVTSVSYSMIDELASYGIKKQVTIIRNGCEPITVLSPIKKQDNNLFNLLYVGRIVGYKNLKLSLDALYQLNKINPNFTFTLVGDGGKKGAIKRYAKKLKLQDKVMFIGQVLDSQILDKHYINSDLLLFLSEFDNDSIVVMEAVKNNLPILVLENSGASERFVDNETAFFTIKNPLEIAKKIDQIIKDKRLLERVKNSEKMVYDSWQEISEQYEQLYIEEITKKRS